MKALTEFVLFHTTGEKWPTHKHQEFWRSASEFIQQRARTNAVSRSGKLYHCSELCTFTLANACRTKVISWLSKRYLSV